jgi:hypothetical protein
MPDAERHRDDLPQDVRPAVGRTVSGELRAPALEDDMSLKKEALLAWIADEKAKTYDIQSRSHAQQPLGGTHTFADLLSWRIGALVELEEDILAGEFDA